MRVTPWREDCAPGSEVSRCFTGTRTWAAGLGAAAAAGEQRPWPQRQQEGCPRPGGACVATGQPGAGGNTAFPQAVKRALRARDMGLSSTASVPSLAATHAPRAPIASPPPVTATPLRRPGLHSGLSDSPYHSRGLRHKPPGMHLEPQLTFPGKRRPQAAGGSTAP